MIQKKTAQTTGTRPARSSNITERRQAEEALRRSEATYRSIFNATNEGILVLDMETGEVVDANATFRNVFGYAPEEARGLRVGDFSSGEPTYTQQDALRLIHEAAGGEPQHFEWLAKSTDARLLWIDVTLKPATIAGRDCVLPVGRDITQRKRAKEALRASEATYRSIFNAATEGILVHDMETGEIVDANAAIRDLFGYTREEALRLRVEDLGSGEAPYTQEDALRWIHKAAEGHPQRFEWRAKDSAGRLFWVDATLKRATIAGQDRVLAIARDVTQRKWAEEALRESETKFRTLTETAAAAVFIYRGTRPLYVNATMERLTGYTREEILARELWQSVHLDFQTLVRERSRARQQGEQAPSRYEFKIVRKSGEERWVDFTAGIIEFEGQPAAIGTAYDITERKQAEEALKDAKQFSEGLLAAMKDGMSVLDAGGVRVYVNPAFCEMTGFSKEELIGVGTPHPYWPAEEREEIERALQRAMRGQFQDFELTFMRKNGERFPVILSPSCTRDSQGNVMHTFATVKDITERKRSEEALRDSERRFRTLSEESFEGIAIHRKGTILEANQPLAAMFGYELSEVIGMHALDFTAPESRDAVLQSILSKSREPFEFTGLRKDGTTFPVEVCGRPIPYQGHMVTVASLRDITERKQAEEALQKAREELEARVERQTERGNPYGLTFRELTVLHVVAAGKADKEIASQLGITTLTASKHLANILRKMGAASRTEAGVRALREGLLD